MQISREEFIHKIKQADWQDLSDEALEDLAIELNVRDDEGYDLTIGEDFVNPAFSCLCTTKFKDLPFIQDLGDKIVINKTKSTTSFGLNDFRLVKLTMGKVNESCKSSLLGVNLTNERIKKINDN